MRIGGGFQARNHGGFVMRISGGIHANTHFDAILCAEDNRDMHESYLMVDPHGRFFQNDPQVEGQGYLYSQPILEVGAAAAFAQMAFDSERFRARYSQHAREHRA